MTAATAAADQVDTPGCRGVMGEVVEQAVAERLLAAVAPEQIAARADRRRHGRRPPRARDPRRRAARRARPLRRRPRRARLSPVRPRQPARRAHASKSRWEAKLRELADAEAELARQAAEPAPPARADIEALARDLPRLWAAPSTLAPRPQATAARADQRRHPDLAARRTRDQRRHPLALGRQRPAHRPATPAPPAPPAPPRSPTCCANSGPTHTNAQLADHLNQAGQLTAQRPPVRRGQRPLAALAPPHPQPVPVHRRRARRPRTRPTPQRRRPRHLRLDPPGQAPRPPHRPPPTRHPLQRRHRGRLPPAPRRLTPNPLPQPNNR